MILPKGHCDHFRMITNQQKPEQSPQSDRIHNICKSFLYDCKHPTKKTTVHSDDDELRGDHRRHYLRLSALNNHWE